MTPVPVRSLQKGEEFVMAGTICVVMAPRLTRPSRVTDAALDGQVGARP